MSDAATTRWRAARGAKRVIDVAGSAVALAFFAIPMAIIWAIVRVAMGSPSIFSQERPGVQGRPFRLLKFRTMSGAVDSSGKPLSDRDRVTSAGRFLRETSLDELPELINVLVGDMSLVGPRPLLSAYLDRYTPRQSRRHEVRPGLTGWAQVNGRNALTWEEKFELDVWYVDNWTIGLDLRILCLTLVKVLRREGISARGSETMPEFLGDRDA